MAVLRFKEKPEIVGGKKTMATRKTIITEQDIMNFVEYVIVTYEENNKIWNDCQNCKANHKFDLVRKIAHDIKFRVREEVYKQIEMKYQLEHIIFPIERIINDKKWKKELIRSAKVQSKMGD